MSMVGNLAKVLAPAALLIASTSFATDVIVPAGPVTIKSIKTNGSGCPLGTVAQNISEDKQAFTLTFSEFIAEIGPNVMNPSSARRNCVITATLTVPVGWQYSIGSFYYRGYMGLDAGIKATHSTSYFFEGQGKTGSFKTDKYGPLSLDFVYTDKIGLESAISGAWSDCTKERALNINTSILVSNIDNKTYPNAQGLITNDSVDGEIKQVFGLTWRKCAS